MERGDFENHCGMEDEKTCQRICLVLVERKRRGSSGVVNSGYACSERWEPLQLSCMIPYIVLQNIISWILNKIFCK